MSFIESREQFEELQRDAERVFSLTAHLPLNPCKIPEQQVCFFPYESVTSEPFWPSLISLAKLHGDHSIQIIIIDPDPVDYYEARFDVFGALCLAIDADPGSYWSALTAAPGNSPADALAFRAETWAAVGHSGEWGFWNEQPYGISIAYSRHIDGLAAWIDSVSSDAVSRETVEGLVAQNFAGSSLPEEFAQTFCESFP